jgi:hypothetical protein
MLQSTAVCQFIFLEKALRPAPLLQTAQLGIGCSTVQDKDGCDTVAQAVDDLRPSGQRHQAATVIRMSLVRVAVCARRSRTRQKTMNKTRASSSPTASRRSCCCDAWGVRSKPIAWQPVQWLG